MAFPSSAKELYHSRTHSRKGWYEWQGRKIWECDTADADDTETEVWVTWWGTMLPRRVAVDPHARVGKAVLTADYYTTGYNPVSHPVGKATLSVELASQVQARSEIEDAWGGVIDLSGKPDEQGFFHRVVEGSRLKRQWLTRVRVNTALARADIDWDTVLNAKGKTNASALGWIGNAPTGTMLLVGAIIPRYFLLDEDATIVPISYTMYHSATGWPAQIVVQKYRQLATRVRIEADWYDEADVEVDESLTLGDPKAWYDEDGETVTVEADGELRSVVKIETIGSSQTVLEISPDIATFSYLGGLLSWML